jgi:hypothetical protein
VPTGDAKECEYSLRSLSTTRPPTARTWNVRTARVARRRKKFPPTTVPVSRSNLTPCHGHATARSDTVPWSSGPFRCPHSASRAYSLPPELNTATVVPPNGTRTERPGSGIGADVIDSLGSDSPAGSDTLCAMVLGEFIGHAGEIQNVYNRFGTVIDLGLPRPCMASARESTRVRTFRLPTVLADKLDGQARTLKVSANTVLVRALDRYLEWELPAERFGFLSIDRDSLQLMLKSVDGPRLVQIAEQAGRKNARDVALFWYGRYDAETIARGFQEIFSYGRFADCRVESRPGGWNVTLRHSLGREWTIWLHHYLDTVLRETLGLRTHFDVTDRTLMFRIPQAPPKQPP